MIDLAQAVCLDQRYARQVCDERLAPDRELYWKIADSMGWSREKFAAWAKARKWA